MKNLLLAALLIVGCGGEGDGWDNNATILVLGDPAQPHRFDRISMLISLESESGGFSIVEEMDRVIMATPERLTLVIKQTFRDPGLVCAYVRAMHGEMVESTAECCTHTKQGFYGQCYATLNHAIQPN